MTAMISNMFGRFLGTMTGQTHLRFVMLESSATQIADPYREGGSEAKNWSRKELEPISNIISNKLVLKCGGFAPPKRGQCPTL